MKKRGKEKGQAVVELITSLVAICVVVLGMILFAVVGTKGVKNTIAARAEADRNMANGNAAASGQYISLWNNISGAQGDGLHFTADDTPLPGSSPDTAVFREELADTDRKFDIGILAASGKTEHFRPFSFSSAILFFKAANLTSGTAILPDPMGDEKLYDVKTALRRFGMSPDFDIRDTVYMPNIPRGDGKQ